jgi:ABC-type glycerol-3-phosphate transport system permease component
VSDGYSRLGAFVRAVVPLVFPGIVAVRLSSTCSSIALSPASPWAR